MSKRTTKIKQVKTLIDANPSITPKEIVEQTGISLSHVYAIRHTIKKRASSPPTTKKARKPRKKIFTYKATGMGGVPFTKNVENLEEEIVRLNDWCLQWRRKCEELRDENEKLREDGRYKQYALDALAVIAYLERKLDGKA
jgi:predicted RNase H-like nuclease (RuvC/YqgF family)